MSMGVIINKRNYVLSMSEHRALLLRAIQGLIFAILEQGGLLQTSKLSMHCEIKGRWESGLAPSNSRETT